MNILVTGAAGFIGSRTVKLLEHHCHSVVAVDNFSTGKTENLKGFRGAIRPYDVTDPRMMREVFYDFQPQAVLHLAAQSAIGTSWADPIHDAMQNIVGTLNLLMFSLQFHVKKFVFSSTSAVYKAENPRKAMDESWPCEPDSPYGISKLAGEQYVRAMFEDHVILRYGNVYGPGQVPIGENQVIARAFSHFILGDPFQVHGDGKQSRDFVYVDDVCAANEAAIMSARSGTYNVARGRCHSVMDVLHEIEEIYGVPGYGWSHDKMQDPRRVVRMGAEKIYREIGWISSNSLRDGLKKTADWWERFRK